MNNVIGNTPMIKIYYEYNGIKKYIYTKLEYFNLTGSIKDRVADRILRNAKKSGELKDGMKIVEATSGNTGISVSAIGTRLGHEVCIFMPDWSSKERVDLMKSYGATVILRSKKDGGFVRCVEESKKFAEENNAFLVNQFSNVENFNAHYYGTAEEILKNIHEKISAFVFGVGTGGTLMGIGKRLKKECGNVDIIALEPDKMPIISTGKIISQHKIEGIGDDFVPDLVDKSSIDDIILINDDDAINMSRRLSKELGLGVGISSGANLIASVLANERKFYNGAVVTVFADDNKKYLSTELSNEIDNNTSYESNKIKLIDYEVI